MAIKLQPLGDRILVKPLAKEEVTRGGIVLPDTVKEKPQEGEVIAVARQAQRQGQVMPMEVAVGDVILYAKYGGTEIKLEGEDYMILRESDILAKRTK